MSPDPKSLEKKLYNDGLQLLSNGHRMTYVFKYIRGKSEDKEMQKRVMERLTADQQVKEIHETRLEEHGESYKTSWIELGGGIALIAFAGYMTKILWDSGWVASLPFALIFFVVLRWMQKK